MMILRTFLEPNGLKIMAWQKKSTYSKRTIISQAIFKSNGLEEFFRTILNPKLNHIGIQGRFSKSRQNGRKS